MSDREDEEGMSWREAGSYRKIKGWRCPKQRNEHNNLVGQWHLEIDLKLSEGLGLVSHYTEGKQV